MNCSVCNDNGVYYDNHTSQGSQGQFKCCLCKVHCFCGGRYPYRYWDENHDNKLCPCWTLRQRRRKVNRLFEFENTGFDEFYPLKFFDDLSPNFPDGQPRPGAEKTIRIAERYLTTPRIPEQGLFLHGDNKEGKTLLGTIVFNTLILRFQKPGRFIETTTWLNTLRDSFDPDNEWSRRTPEIFGPPSEWPIAMIGNLAIKRETTWAEDTLHQLIDNRYANMRFTIVTTNLPLKAVSKLCGGRIFPLLREMCQFVEMNKTYY